MESKILAGLNKRQIEAVKMRLAPVLVIAGPGTGKTRLLVSRIAWLITHCYVKPDNILALTFTNKAATEMKLRLLELMGSQGQDVYSGTFHSFALNLLRKYHARVNLAPFFSVCDQDYQFQLASKLCQPYIKENLELKVRGMLLSFSNHVIKNKTLSEFASKRFAEYRQHLLNHSLIDFDQILYLCHQLLKDNRDVREEYQHLFQAILIDEFQDTDPIQYEIIKILGITNKNIFAVADDDQSIYSWRGASPENIKKYIEDFSIKKPIILQINYRNGSEILENAQRIIKQIDRIEPGKQLQVDKEKINKIDLKFYFSEKDEFNFILNKIEEWVKSGIPYQEIAIIYPFHKIGHALEPFIIKKQVPYQMTSGKSFLDSHDAKRIFLYFRFMKDPDDPISFEELTRIELGESLFGMLKHLAIKERQSLRKIIYRFYADENGQLPYDSILKIRNFIAHLANLVNLKDFYSFNQLVDEINMESNYTSHSVLFQNRKLLTPFNKIDKLLSDTIDLFNKSQICVYHSDESIAFLAAECLKSILNRQIEIVSDHNKKHHFSDDSILVELRPFENDSGVFERIPIYEIGNDKRRAALSNLYKFMQWYVSKINYNPLSNYVIVDLETTDKNKNTCGIVEIAAVKVKNNEIVDRIQSLINPHMKITKEAEKVHHISPADVKDAPMIEEFWQEFITFVGDEILIAHNGYNFDFPILDRFAKKISNKKLANHRLDSLVIARNLFPSESNSIDALMHRFCLQSDERHRALEDVIVLKSIMEKLVSLRFEVERLTSLEMFLDTVALANYIEGQISAEEDRLFFIGGGSKLASAYSKIRTTYTNRYNINENEFKTGIWEKMRELYPQFASYQIEDHLLEKIKEVASQYNLLPFEQAVAQFLNYLSLNTGQDQLEDINAISLLTYHSAKGLEFDKVILMGMEEENMPGFHALRVNSDDDRPVSKKLDEQRRLLYVGMTRAKTELILTAVKNRGGWEHKSSSFLRDIKLSPQRNNEVELNE